MPLTAVQVRNAKAGRHLDAKGLYLFVKPSGAKSWVLRVQADGKRRDLGLGPVDLVPLAEAREKALQGRRMMRDGLDPSHEWKRKKGVIPTFATVAREYHESIKAGFKNARHSASWLSSIEAYAVPIIGAQRVNSIDATAIHSALAPIWLTIPETARRVRQRIGLVLDYAKAKGWRVEETPMRSVATMLPKHKRVDNHFAAMPYSDVAAFLRGVEAKGDTIGRLALRFTILTAARSGETRGATWDEIDLEGKVWSIPANRMKAGQPHSVPLTDAALTVLEIAKAFATGGKGDLVFKGLGGKALSDMTLTKALRTAGVEAFTVHGFRSAFRDWAAEQTSFPGEWAEAALAHTLSNKVEAAYRRTKYLDQRRKMMDAWADYLSGAENVLRLVRTS